MIHGQQQSSSLPNVFMKVSIAITCLIACIGKHRLWWIHFCTDLTSNVSKEVIKPLEESQSLTITLCSTQVHGQVHSTEQTHSAVQPNRPRTLKSSGGDNYIAEEDGGYCRFIPPSAVGSTPTLSSSSGSSWERRDEEDPVYTTIRGTGHRQKYWWLCH